MWGQFRVELRRLLHRRVLLGFAGFTVLALIVVGLSLFYTSGPEEYGTYADSGGFEVDEFGNPVDPVELPEPLQHTFCPSSLVTSAGEQRADDDYLYGFVCPQTTPTSVPKQDDYEGTPALYNPWNGAIAYFSVGAMIALWLLAASFIGGEFRFGTVETALVAEPRRARLLTLRLAAVLTVGLGSYLVAAAGFLLAVAPTWALRSIEGTSVSLPAIVAAVGRGALAAVLITLISASLTVIGRNSIASLGVLVAMTAATAVLFLFLRPFVPLEFFTNVWAVITGGDGMRAYSLQLSINGPSVNRYGRGWPFAGALAVVVAYAAVTCSVAYATFVRRDVR